MTVEVESPVRRVAAKRAGLEYRDRAIEGPLQGYHHETYVIPLPPIDGVGAEPRRGKVREPRPGLFWYDRRCFRSEEVLLAALWGRVHRIPEIIEVAPGVRLQGFVEGRTLTGGVPGNRPLSLRHGSQLGQLFRELAAIKTEEIDVERICRAEDRPEEGDCVGFLAGLIRFTHERVYTEHGAPFHGLFERLGVGGAPLQGLLTRARGLGSRPFTLLHGDLHRENFIVDPHGDLWTIDWELALFGDPLYDLATHLHLMRYQADEEERICRIWQSAVEGARPGATQGWREDLPVLLEYKRAQSVYTDVIRGALALEQPEGALDRRTLPEVARQVQLALAGAQKVPGMPTAPALHEVARAYRWWVTSRPSFTASAS
ncbi:phosphotransferase [Streptomyces sp. NPDC048590]|uniref:phosphotransferase n=1 Tax=Streptomyces sp. NPDC048590 TaxID=3365574 RepID=UPI0037182BD1